MNVTVIGTGFVGVVSAAVFASFHNHVTGLDVDPKKVESLNQGKVPFFEPQLEELLQAGLAEGSLVFTTEYEKAISHAEVILVAVGTPSAPDGTADLTFVRAACKSLAPHLQQNAIVCIKSTVPPGTLHDLEARMRPLSTVPFTLASLPEFLREGSAVADTLHPDRVVIGCQNEAAQGVLARLHEPLGAPIIFVSPESAQMGKYAANAYLATRITFINQIADLCEENGANVEEVIRIIGEDKRIGKHYWYPGLGYGGSCFPKDVKELAAYSRTVGHGNNLFNKINDLNNDRVYIKLDEFSRVLGGWSGKTVAVLGLSFKPHTDDMREAPSTKVIPHLLHSGATVQAYDPLALEAAKKVLGEPVGLRYAESIAAALEGAEVVMVLIEWPEFLTYGLAEKKPASAAWFIDARNQFSPEGMTAGGWKYIGIGREVRA